MSKYQCILTGKRRSLRGALLVLLVIGLQILLTSKPALAHATLIRAEPADGEVLTLAPSEVQLWLSEPVVTNFSSVLLLDEQNQPVLGPSIRGDSAESTVLDVTLPALKPGTYTLLWKTLDGSDGHFSQGFTTFSVGQNTGAPPRPRIAATSFSALPPWVEGGLRWANFLFVASLVGALAIVQFVLTSVTAQATALAAAAQYALRRRILRWAAGCAAGAWLIGLGLLAWQVASTQAALSVNATWSVQTWSMLMQTHWGALWLVRQALLLFVGAGLWWLTSRRQAFNSAWPFLVIAGRAVDLLIVQALSGHAISSSPNWLLALGNATVHLLAASLWMGGLIALAVIVLPTIKRGIREATAWHALNWYAFSWLAVLNVGLLIATGLFSMGQQVASLDALLTTVYGQLLLGKLSVVLLAVVCGLLNTMLVHPHLASPFARWLGRPSGWTPLRFAQLPRLIGLEVALGVLIFALTGLLTATPPPRGVEFTIAPEDITPSLGQRVGEFFVTLDVTPNRPGQNLFTVRNVATQPATSTEIAQVLLRFSSPNANRDPVVAVAELAGPGLYQLTGNYLDLAGPWQIDVVTKRPGQPDTLARFNWVVAPPGVLQPVVWSKRPLNPLLTWLAGCWLFAIGLGVVGWRWRTSRPAPTSKRQSDERLLGPEAVVQPPVYP